MASFFGLESLHCEQKFLANWLACWVEMPCRLRHRGPDWSGLHCNGDCYLAHQRLAIVDPTSGDQPLYNEDKTIVVTVLFSLWDACLYLVNRLRRNVDSVTSIRMEANAFELFFDKIERP